MNSHSPLPEEGRAKRLGLFIYSMAGGGAERTVSLLLPLLARHARVVLILMNDRIDYDLPPGVEIRYLEHSAPDEPGIKKLLKLPLLGWRLARLCRKEKLDTLMAFMNRPNYVAVLARLMGSRVRTIISERAAPSLQHGYGDLQSRINRFLIRRLYPLAHRVIANSRGNRADLVENFGLAPEKVLTLYNPLDRKAIEEKAALPVDFDFAPFTFVTAGRMDRGKNHRMLLEALAQSGLEECKLILLGTGPLREELEEEARRMGIGERVFFPGFDPNPYRWMAKSHCFLFGSNHEGFPNVLSEALACGLPVISTDCPHGPREILAPGTEPSYRLVDTIEPFDAGALVPVGRADLMARAMRDQARSARKPEHLSQRLERFQIETIANQYRKALDDRIR